MGALSGVVVVVAHIVPSPAVGFDATQPAGRAGAVTESKVSTHGGPAVAVAVGDGPPAVAVAVAVGDGPPAVAVAVGVAVFPGVAEGTGAPVPRS